MKKGWTYKKVNWKEQTGSRANAHSVPSGSSTGDAPTVTATGLPSANGPPMGASKSSEPEASSGCSTSVPERVTSQASGSAACWWAELDWLNRWAFRRGETVEQSLAVIRAEMDEEYPEKRDWTMAQKADFYMKQNIIHV